MSADDGGTLPAFSLGRLPRITFGPGSIERLPEIAASHGHRALLVTGVRSLVASGRLEEIERRLTEGGVEAAGTINISGEPSPSHAFNLFD